MAFLKNPERTKMTKYELFVQSYKISEESALERMDISWMHYIYRDRSIHIERACLASKHNACTRNPV